LVITYAVGSQLASAEKTPNVPCRLTRLTVTSALPRPPVSVTSVPIRKKAMRRGVECRGNDGPPGKVGRSSGCHWRGA
jgi:hypothetical protein